LLFFKQDSMALQPLHRCDPQKAVFKALSFRFAVCWPSKPGKFPCPNLSMK